MRSPKLFASYLLLTMVTATFGWGQGVINLNQSGGEISPPLVRQRQIVPPVGGPSKAVQP